MLALIPFSVIEKVGPDPGNAAWEFNQAMHRVEKTTAGVATGALDYIALMWSAIYPDTPDAPCRCGRFKLAVKKRPGVNRCRRCGGYQDDMTKKTALAAIKCWWDNPSDEEAYDLYDYHGYGG